MAWSLDTRIPLLRLGSAEALAAALAEGPPAAVLTEGTAVAPGGVAGERFSAEARHVASCACCTGRSQAATALDRLFQARVRGQVPWFERVLALAPSAAGRAALDQALAGDALTRARFRAG